MLWAFHKLQCLWRILLGCSAAAPSCARTLIVSRSSTTAAMVLCGRSLLASGHGVLRSSAGPADLGVSLTVTAALSEEGHTCLLLGGRSLMLARLSMWSLLSYVLSVWQPCWAPEDPPLSGCWTCAVVLTGMRAGCQHDAYSVTAEGACVWSTVSQGGEGGTDSACVCCDAGAWRIMCYPRAGAMSVWTTCMRGVPTTLTTSFQILMLGVTF